MHAPRQKNKKNTEKSKKIKNSPNQYLRWWNDLKWDIGPTPLGLELTLVQNYPSTHAWAACQASCVRKGEYAYSSWGVPPPESDQSPLESDESVMKIHLKQKVVSFNVSSQSRLIMTISLITTKAWSLLDRYFLVSGLRSLSTSHLKCICL